jgi:hypothetical protein
MNLIRRRKVETNGTAPLPGLAPRRSWTGMVPPGIAQHPLDPDQRHPWTHPPLFSPERQALQAAPLRLLEELKGLLARPLDAWHLAWTYWTQVAPATERRDDLLRNLDAWVETENQARAAERERVEAQLDQAEGWQKSLEDQLTAEQDGFSLALAATGLTLSVEPETIATAIQECAPNLPELAGAEGLLPVTDPSPSSAVAMLATFAPVVSGVLLSLCLGTLVGLVKLSDLSRGDRWPKLLVAAVVGAVIAWLLGEVVSYATTSLARSLERRREGVPGFRCELFFASGLVLMAMICGGAEIVAEAQGLRDLHVQRLLELKRLNVDAGLIPALPLWFYALIGSIVTAPYLLYKAASRWNECQQELRHAWLLHRRREWILANCDNVQAVLKRAQRIQRLTAEGSAMQCRIEILRKKLEQLEPVTQADEATMARIQDAELTAVAEAERFHGIIDERMLEQRPEKA